MTAAVIDTEQSLDAQVALSRAEFERLLLCEARLKEFTSACQHDGPYPMIRSLRNIIVSEFSYDGEDPKGVKRYQSEVDAADYLLREAMLRCP